MEDLEKDMASVNLSDKEQKEVSHCISEEQEEASRPDTPNSDSSDDSFHSFGDEDRGVPNHHSEFRTSKEETQDSSEEFHTSDIPENEAYVSSEGKVTEKPWNEAEEPEEEDDEDFVDEEYLKDLELSLSEEEKNAKREESQKQKESGNASFKTGQFEEAVTTYTSGLRICPLSYPKDRAVLYSNRAAAKARMDLKKEAIKDCSKAIELDDAYTKAILRRATLNEETGQLDEALKDFQRVLQLDPTNQESHHAVRRLPDMINERNEKLKEEMMGKLKDLGNMFLRPFGLSTANFELKQDPSSGGYNINFNQNPPNS
ncbi:tetratricopeptide repeat protein 1 isoform X1 [Panulirus ornatus]|uniref:tetratricopeptide repeat protein 1 isoform X1 n=1 Tax=Panulirus ornatus TaxID=150431 RepID=UPI003A8525E3